jgi:hypothetical protein
VEDLCVIVALVVFCSRGGGELLRIGVSWSEKPRYLEVVRSYSMILNVSFVPEAQGSKVD